MTKKLGCVIGGWNIFRGGCFHAIDIANQSVNLVRSAHRLPPRYLTSPKVGWQDRGGFIFLGRDNDMDTVQWVISAAMDYRSPRV